MGCPVDCSNGLSGGLFRWTVRRLFQWTLRQTLRRTSLSGRTISGMVTGQSPENCTSFNYEILQFSGLLSGPDNVGDCKDLGNLDANMTSLLNLTPVLHRFCSRTFSVSVCSRPFSALPSHSFLLFCPSPSPFVPSLSVFAFRHFRLILSVFHIRIRPVLVSSDLAFMLSLLLFGYIPYQPNPIVPRFLIIFCSYCLMIRSPLLFRYV